MNNIAHPYISLFCRNFNIKINSHGTSDSWAGIHILKNNYNDVPINDGYWSVSGIPITFKKAGNIDVITPYYTISGSYQPGFSDWRHVEIFYNYSTFNVYVDKVLSLQGSYTYSGNAQYYGIYTKSTNVLFDELVIRNTINP